MFFKKRFDGVKTEIERIEKEVNRLRFQYHCPHAFLKWERGAIHFPDRIDRYNIVCGDCEKQIKYGLTYKEFMEELLVICQSELSKMEAKP